MSRKSRITFTAVALVLLFLFGMVFSLHYRSERSIDQANSRRFRSPLLADEWRQTSDDLTTTARTYMATGDLRSHHWFFDILPIRDGQPPVPSNDRRVHWNTLAAGVTPREERASPPWRWWTGCSRPA